ncbi:MAG: KpsF/GutQ family sugar-phosphate isomerase [Lactobacillales bacterium]|nr:KpsF/GutQ family sugar-phosphate isomerase [Lactobacillales bacterium]
MTEAGIIECASRVIDTEINGLKSLKASIGPSFLQAVKMISDTTGRVIISGMGKSGHIGQKIAATLASTGTPAFFVHPSEASHGDLGMITPKDVLICISNSGESKEMHDIISYARRFSIPLIVMTSNPDSTMARHADVALLIPNAKSAPEACPLGLAPTTSTTMTLAMGDALAVALIELKEFSAEQFRDRHPGGKLGNVLLKVSDIMVRGDALPLVYKTTMMADALLVMTEKSLGCVGVVDGDDHLIGIITDGDLRRHMAADLIVRSAGDIMTANPKTVTNGTLCAEALGMMNAKEITNFFVVDENKKPIGVIHIHQLLQAGVK